MLVTLKIAHVYTTKCNSDFVTFFGNIVSGWELNEKRCESKKVKKKKSFFAKKDRNVRALLKSSIYYLTAAEPASSILPTREVKTKFDSIHGTTRMPTKGRHQ